MADPRVEMYLRGMSLQEVGERLGVSHAAVRQYLERRGIPRRPRAMTDRDKQEWVDTMTSVYLDQGA